MTNRVANMKNFEENFEDSELVSEGQYVQRNSDGEPIQLIKIKQFGEIQVNPEALDIIASCDLPVGFCCLVGKYRTGKSFLLNKLLHLQGAGFRVDPSTNACTQGIWMWSKPVINQREGNYVFFLDTEGTASLTKDSNNDAKIFTLANLISSYLVFNSVGCIDEKSISQLNLVTQLSKNIILEEHMDLRNNQQNLYRYMPKFLWVLRDFTLELADERGKKMTAAQYLQNCLFENNESIKSNENVKKVRRALVKYYKDRDCLTLIRPANQEAALYDLNTLPDYELRRQFIDGVNILRDKILSQTSAKYYDQTPLYGSSIASMIQSYAKTMNDGGIPNLKTAWEQINDDEGLNAFELALVKFNDLYEQNFQQDEPKGEQIHHLLRVIISASMDEFRHNISEPNIEYENKLKEFLDQKESQVLQINKELIAQRNIEILRESMSPVLQKLESNAYVDNADELNIDLKKATERYNSMAKGEQKGDLLGQFLADLQPIILQQTSRKQPQNEGMKNYQKEAYEKQIQILQKRLKSVENQARAAQAAQRANLANGKKPNQIKKSSKKPNKKGDGEKAGCCGKSNCAIM